MIKETYYDNLRFLEDHTEKVLLNQSDLAKILKIDRKTVAKRYGQLMTDGLISVPSLARALTK